MAIREQIQQWFQENPNATETDVYNAMVENKVDVSQLSDAMNFNQDEVQKKYLAQQALAQQSMAPTVDPSITNLRPNTPATPPTTIYDPTLADRSFADVTPASTGIAVPTLQATTPNKPPEPVGALQTANIPTSATVTTPPVTGALQTATTSAPETEAQWKARQPTDAYLNSLPPMERRVVFESWQMSRPGYVNPMDYNTYEQYIAAANPMYRMGTDAGDDLRNQANFYGLTIENYQNALKTGEGSAGNLTGSKLLSPLQRIAEQTARGQGIAPATLSPEMQALAQKYPNYFVDYAKKYPDVFNKASQDFSNFMKTTYPGTLEYQSVLSGPMKFSNTGVEYPKIDNTAGMYSVNPVTKQISNNPNYQPTTSEKIARKYMLDPKTKRWVRNPAYKAPVKKASGGNIKISNNPAKMFLEMVESIPKRK